jgi:hypothetical protein
MMIVDRRAQCDGIQNHTVTDFTVARPPLSRGNCDSRFLFFTPRLQRGDTITLSVTHYARTSNIEHFYQLSDLSVIRYLPRY